MMAMKIQTESPPAPDYTRSGRIRLACMSCDDESADGVDAIPPGWHDVEKTQCLDRSKQIEAHEPGGFDETEVYEWWTHIGWCPDCTKLLNEREERMTTATKKTTKKKTAKKAAKASKNGAPKKKAAKTKKRQQFIDKGIENDKLDKQIEGAAEEYREICVERAALSIEEAAAKERLHGIMKKKKRKTYKCVDVRNAAGKRLEVIVEPGGDETVKLKPIKGSKKKEDD